MPDTIAKEVLKTNLQTENSIKMENVRLLVQCLEILLLPNLKKYFHWIAIVINFGKTREVFLNFIPVPIVHLVLKIFHIEEKSRFLLKPIMENKAINAANLSTKFWKTN